MELNRENIERMVKQSYSHHVFKAFGQEGKEALTCLLDAVKQIYAHCPPEQLEYPLTLISAVAGDPTKPMLAQTSKVTTFGDAKAIAKHILNQTTLRETFVEVLNDNTFCVVENVGEIVDIELIKPCCVIYRYEATKERIVASDFDEVIARVSPALASNFAEPTYTRLEDALVRYDNLVAETGCRLLRKVWEEGADGPRLVLINKPESTMRDSLVQFLQTLLSERANVRPEQNVDETKPVDIRIDWFGTDASALIEIKWIGRSTAIPRSENGAPYTNYGESRANSGAKQLADYLDRDRHNTRAIRPLGYLVVFDARRRNVKGPADLLSREDAFWYEDKDINYNPKQDEIRSDFARPVRFFLRPRESNLQVST